MNTTELILSRINEIYWGMDELYDAADDWYFTNEVEELVNNTKDSCELIAPMVNSPEETDPPEFEIAFNYFSDCLKDLQTLLEKYQKEFEELVEKYFLADQYYFYLGNIEKLNLYDRNHYLYNVIIVLMNILHPERNIVEIEEDEVVEIKIS